MTDRPEPPEDAGINAIRLDAERTRDELERTLEEIERRLDPRPRIEAVKRAYNNSPAAFIAAAAGVLGTVGGLIVWSIVRSNLKSKSHPEYLIVETKAKKIRG